MGVFSGIGRAIHSPGFGDRLQAALAAAQGDPQAVYRLRELQRQNAELAIRQRAEQRAEEDRNNQVWGAKEAGYTNPAIAAMSTGDLSQSMRERLAPHQFGPTGGSVGTPDATGRMTFQQAPWRDTFGTDMLQSDGTAPPSAIASRVEPVPVQGMGVYGWSNGGQVDPGQAPGSFTPGGTAPRTAPQTPQLPSGPPIAAPRLGQARPTAYGDPVAELSRIVGVAPSSGFRTQAHQDALVRQGLTHTRTGAHQRGDGLDFPIPAGPRQQAAAAQIQQRYPQARFAFEGTNLHVSLPGWGRAPDLSGSARRYPGAGGPPVTAQGPQGQTYYRIGGQWYDNPEGR